MRTWLRMAQSVNGKTSAAPVGLVSATLWGRLPIFTSGIPIDSDIGVNTGGDGVSEISERDSMFGWVGVSDLRVFSPGVSSSGPATEELIPRDMRV